MDCHAVFVKTARNDGQRKRTLSFYNDGTLLSFWAFDRKRKIHLQKRQGIVILSVSEISTLWFYGYFASLSMTRQVKFINITKQVGIISILRYFTLLRKVQYDKDLVNMIKFISETKFRGLLDNSFVHKFRSLLHSIARSPQ